MSSAPDCGISARTLSDQGAASNRALEGFATGAVAEVVLFARTVVFLNLEERGVFLVTSCPSLWRAASGGVRSGRKCVAWCGPGLDCAGLGGVVIFIVGMFQLDASWWLPPWSCLGRMVQWATSFQRMSPWCQLLEVRYR